MTKMINLDTNFFYIAFDEWKRENDCPLANYNELRLDDRSRIMIRAQELKNLSDSGGAGRASRGVSGQESNMEKTVIGKCGHDVVATVSDEGEYLNVPDCCKDCEEPPENQIEICPDCGIEICPDCGFSVIGCICGQRGLCKLSQT